MRKILIFLFTMSLYSCSITLQNIDTQGSDNNVAHETFYNDPVINTTVEKPTVP